MVPVKCSVWQSKARVFRPAPPEAGSSPSHADIDHPNNLDARATYQYPSEPLLINLWNLHPFLLRSPSLPSPAPTSPLLPFVLSAATSHRLRPRLCTTQCGQPPQPRHVRLDQLEPPRHRPGEGRYGPPGVAECPDHQRVLVQQDHDEVHGPEQGNAVMIASLGSSLAIGFVYLLSFLPDPLPTEYIGKGIQPNRWRSECECSYVYITQ